MLFTFEVTYASELSLDTVSLERDGHVLIMGLNRPAKRNAFNVAMLADLSRAYALLEADDELRAGVLIAHGDHFTAGLDLVDVAPYLADGRDPMPEDGRDPWRLDGNWTKPVVAAAHGRCLTLGIELLLGADIRIADHAAPLGVRATLASAHLARSAGDAAAIDALRPEVVRLFGTADAAEGVQSFIERRPARFNGC